MKMYVVDDDTSDGFDFRMGLAETQQEAIGLYDVDGWRAVSAREGSIELDSYIKSYAAAEEKWAEEIEEGGAYISEGWGGYKVECSVWVLETEETDQ